jgi:hypothetical protein
MQIESFKTWHWMLIGVFVGLLFGGVKLWQGPTFDVDSQDSLDQPSFEHALLAIPERSQTTLVQQYRKQLPGDYLVTGLTVHPPSPDDPKVYWVSGWEFRVTPQRPDPKTPGKTLPPYAKWTRFIYKANSPYTAFNGAPGKYPTIVEYLRAFSKLPVAKFTFRVAWWENPTMTLVLPSFAGLLLIGIVWPLTLNLMVRTGLAKQPEPKAAKLPKNRTSPTKAAVDTSAGYKQLDDLNAQLEKSTADFASSTPILDEEDIPAPIKPLGGPTVPATNAPAKVESEEEVRTYGGEFYPVVREVHKSKVEDRE